MNTRYYYIFSLLFTFFSFQSIGQSDVSIGVDSNFLKDYIPQNYTFQALQLSPSFRESILRSDNFDRNRLDISLYANHILRSQKDKSDLDMNTTLRSRYYSDEQNDVKNDINNYYEFSIDANADNYFYFAKKAFVSLGYLLSTDNRKNYLNDDFSTNNQYFGIPISIGFGRPYRINDAWNAMTLFNDLECYGIAVDRSKTKEVADLISTQRNRRFRDNRLGRIENYTELIEYLDNNDIVKMTPLSSSVLNDSRRFENFTGRFSGFRINVGVMPTVVSFKIGNGTDMPEEDNDFVINSFLRFNYYLPISEDWQFNAYSYISYGKMLYSEDLNSFSTTNIASINWIPSARLWTSAELQFRTFNNETLVKSESVSLSFSCNYYVSPRIRWTTRFFISKNWQEINSVNNQNFEQIWSGGLSYYIL